MPPQKRDEYPEPKNHRQKINNFLNCLLDSEISPQQYSFYIPPIELKETGQAFFVNLEIPGITKRHIDLKINQTVVIIRGERQINKIENKKTVFSNFRYGKWQRVIIFPVPIKIDGSSAKYIDGILKIVLYKQ